MNIPIQISAKNLGALAMPDFCPRCFWIGMKVEKLPYQIFPGIFSSLDSYQKKVIHQYIDRNEKLPQWLSSLGEIQGYKPCPHSSKFRVLDKETNILLTGAMDDLFLLQDGSHLIVDYKTAKFTENQDALLPVYTVQLNGYAYIAERTGISPVSQLVLVYMEPITTPEEAARDEYFTPDGYVMKFIPQIHPISLDLTTIPPLLHKVREIMELPKPPQGREGCENCRLVEQFIKLF